MRRSWDGVEIKFLKDNYNNFSNTQLSEKLNRSKSSVEKKLKSLKLKKDSRKFNMKWSHTDISFLSENYSNMTNKELSDILERSPKTILNKASKMGLSKSKGHLNKISESRIRSGKVTLKKGDHVCVKCGNGFDSLNGLQIHLSKKHPDLKLEKYYNDNIGTYSKCKYCNSPSQFISLFKGYSDKCSSDECLSKSRSSGSVEWHSLNHGNLHIREVQLKKRLKSLKDGDNKRLESNPNYYKEKSHNSVEYWIKRGYGLCESIKKSNEVIEYMQSISHNLRKENPEEYSHTYNTKLEYYLNMGMSEDEAYKSLKDRQTTFSKEICIEKYGEKEGIRRWEERQSKWMETMDSKSDEEKREINYKKIKNCKFFSKISIELFDSIYDEIGDNFEKIYYRTLNREYHLYDNGNKKHFLYDFVLKDNMKCIEFNGWFWHCKPEIYESDYYNKVKSMYAHEIWEIDRIKYERLLKEGFDLLIIWEDDYKKDRKANIQKCIDFLLENN